MDDEHSPKSHVNTSSLPLLKPDNEKGSDPPLPPRPTTSAWRTIIFFFFKYWAFAAHLALIALVSTSCLRFLDGRTFNVNSRRPQYQEVDGSPSYATSYALLQSDITTAVSLAATLTRVASGWWAAGFIWRCVFVAMERGGISAKGVSQAISSPLHILCGSTRKSNMVIIYITLFATFAIDYFSAVLTGSFIWEAADTRTPGKIPLTITNGSAHELLTNSWQTPVLTMASADASVAWILQSGSVLNITEPSTTFRRVIQGAQYICINSTLDEVMMPYFAVDSVEWVRDPNQVLTNRQMSLLNPLNWPGSDYSPFQIGSPLEDGGFLPDVQWGEGPQTPVLGDQAMPISETRLFALQIVPKTLISSCPQNYTIDPGLQINLFQAELPDDATFSVGVFCFGIANVSYRAGVFSGRNCKIISPNVVEAQAPFPLVGSAFTSSALGITPLVVSNLLLLSYAIPLNYGTRKDFAIELTSRAYQAAWTALSDFVLDVSLVSPNTTVQIALPRLRAKIIHWRVYLWVTLHLWVLSLGLLFVHVQSHCDHPWVEDPTMAVFWLDTRAVLTDPEGQRVSDPWQPGTEGREDGMLILERNETGQRSVQVRRDSGSRQRRYSDSIPLRHRMPPSSSTILREESRESVERLIRTSVPTSVQTSSLDSTRTPKDSAE